MAADEVSPRAYAPILSSGTVFCKNAPSDCSRELRGTRIQNVPWILYGDMAISFYAGSSYQLLQLKR